MSKNLKNIGLVSLLTMASRVLGLVRESVTAAVFGTGPLISAFFTGLTLPNLFRRLLAEGGMTAAFVPTLNDELHHRQNAGAFTLVNQVVSWLAAVTLGIVGLAMLVFSQGWLIEWVGRTAGADANTVSRWLAAARFTVVLFPYLVFVSLAAAFSAALQTLNRFVEPALSPIWLNLAVLALLGVAWQSGSSGETGQVNWLAAGWLLGGFLQMAVPAWALMRQGWTPRMDFTRSPALRAMVALMVPTLFSSSIYLVNMSVSRLIGLSLNDEAVSVLNYAQRLMELPIGVFAIGVATVVFPLISRYAAAGDFDNLAGAYQKGMRLILLVNVPAAVGLLVLALPIIRVLFEHGEFGPASTTRMVPVLAANAIGLPFVSFVSLALRAFYARKDTVIPVRGALLSLFVNVGLSLLLMGRMAEVGLALASSAASAAQAFYLQWHLARKQEALAFRHLAPDLIKIVMAAAAMGLLVDVGWRFWAGAMPVSTVSDLAGLLLFVVLGVASYGAVAWLLRIHGREEVIGLWSKFRRKLGG